MEYLITSPITKNKYETYDIHYSRESKGQLIDMSRFKPSEVQLDGLKVTEFFDRDFINIIESTIEGAKFQHFCIYVTEEKEDGEHKITERYIMVWMFSRAKRFMWMVIAGLSLVDAFGCRLLNRVVW